MAPCSASTQEMSPRQPPVHPEAAISLLLTFGLHQTRLPQRRQSTILPNVSFPALSLEVVEDDKVHHLVIQASHLNHRTTYQGDIAVPVRRHSAVAAYMIRQISASKCHSSTGQANHHDHLTAPALIRHRMVSMTCISINGMPHIHLTQLIPGIAPVPSHPPTGTR